MRRTDEEFKAEVFRRSEAYRIRRRKRRQKIVLACLPVLLCCGGLLAIMSSGFGASSETAAYSMNAAVTMDECAEEPAAAVEEEMAFDSAAAQGSNEMEGNLGTDGSYAAIMKIEVTSQPEMEEYARTFSDPQQIEAIREAIQAFFDDPDTVPGGDNVGSCEGMSYRIIVTEETITREYTLFNNGLSSEDGWFVNPKCYKVLEELIIQEVR